MVPKYIVAREVGEVGHTDPARLNPPRELGKSPYINLEGIRYYITNQIPPGWKGDFQVVRDSSSPTVFYAEAISNLPAQQTAKPSVPAAKQTPVPTTKPRVDSTTIEHRVEVIPTATKAPEPSKPVVSLAYVDPEKAPVSGSYTLLLHGGGTHSRPWVVAVDEDYLLAGNTLGYLLDHPDAFLRTRGQREAYEAVKAETSNPHYEFRLGQKTYRRDTPLLDIFGDKTNIEGTVEGKKPDVEVAKRGSQVSAPPKTTVARATVAGTARVG